MEGKLVSGFASVLRYFILMKELNYRDWGGYDLPVIPKSYLMDRVS